jgi:hypothetical protein
LLLRNSYKFLELHQEKYVGFRFSEYLDNRRKYPEGYFQPGYLAFFSVVQALLRLEIVRKIVCTNLFQL